MKLDKVLYRTELGAANYAQRLLEEDGAVAKAKPLMLSVDPPQWTVLVRLKNGLERWAAPAFKGYVERT